MKNVELLDFEKSDLLVRATAFSVSQIGERISKLEAIFGEKYPDVPWKEAKYMRNMIVHDYGSVNVKVIYSTAKNDLPILKEKLLLIKNNR